MTHLDLFSGIGGFALAARWAGIETVQFVEIDPFCRKVLQKNFPGVPIHDDIKTFHWTGASPFILTGGFPCQDISVAGKQGGIRAEKSGLWSRMHDIIGRVKPDWVLVENVANLLNGGNGEWFTVVLCDLASIGYDAEWHCIHAASVGAPHIRDRIWIIAYPSGKHGKASEGARGSIFRGLSTSIRRIPEWPPEPKILRVDDGIPNQLDRLKSLGNAVVPQIPYIIMTAIKEIYDTT